MTIELSQEIKTFISCRDTTVDLAPCKDFLDSTDELYDSLAQNIIFSHILESIQELSYVENLTTLLYCLNSSDKILNSHEKVKSFLNMIDFTKFDLSLVYEEYIKLHKPELRSRRGIYFTPKPIVNFIVHSIDYLLQDHFKLKDGLLNIKKGNVYFIDPALGTGTFLDILLYNIYIKFQSSTYDLPDWRFFVREHLLPSVTGIELLRTPLTIAQLRLIIRLLETGYKVKGTEIHIINENALQRSVFEKNMNEIFDKRPITVILGNPPFSRHSATNSPWIDDLLHGIDDYQKSDANYFSVDGQPLEERNPKWLNDDYVKFLRLGHWLLDQTGQGIIAFVLNHSITDNPTFRGLRQELINSFTDIFVLDLHGNSRRKEVSPTGNIDKNVFDIQQGICILILVKNPRKNPPANVYRYDLWGSKKEKFDFLSKNNVSSVKWEKVQAFKPWYFFYNFDSTLYEEYFEYWKLTDIFQSSSVGIMTGNDSLTIQFSPHKISNVIKDLITLPKEDFVKEYSLDTKRQWTYDKARNDVMNCIVGFGESKKELHKKIQKFTQPILYRPFDLRYTFYTGKSRGFHERPRGGIMKHMINCENLALIVSKSSKPSPWRDVIVSSNIAELGVIATRPGNNAPLFPLYLCDSNSKSSKKPNLTKPFMNFIRQISNTPELIFYYILAILYSNVYRSRYGEFLKIDFPRIPFPASQDVFDKLALLGKNISKNLLLQSSGLDRNIIKIEYNGSHRIIETIKYESPNVIRLNQNLFITNVSKDVYNYHIGSYQICRKLLRDH
ncbi:MAG: type ISP restriction/modification enzyme, partial [Candidatus Hodarchaeales archaeon]